MKLAFISSTLFFFYFTELAYSGSVIHVEFDFDLDTNTISDWEVGPVFSFDDDRTELELPIGQSEGEWEVSPELTRELCLGDFCSLEFGIGAEISVSEQEFSPFTRMEIEIDF